MLKSKVIIIFITLVLGMVLIDSFIETKNVSAVNTDKSIVNVN